MAQWQEMIERAAGSSISVNWTTGQAQTIGYLARIDGKYFFVQFFVDGSRAGEIATAFAPTGDYLGAILRHTVKTNVRPRGVARRSQ